MNVAPPSANSCTALDAMRLIAGLIRPVESETVGYENCLGRTLREEVRAFEDQPPFDRSSVDGYAIRKDSVNSRFAIVDHIRAGDWKPRAVESGEAIQIATGGALPCPGLRVVMKEDVVVEGRAVIVVRHGDEPNIRFRGEDYPKGALLMSPGTLLNPGGLAILAGLGRVQIAVTRLPRVIHAVTGNEIVPPEHTPLFGQIRDTNSILVRGIFKTWGIDLVQIRVPEDESAIKARLRDEFVADTDMLLISGGASVGEHDFTRKILEELGFTIQLCRTNTRPGKPLIFGTRGGAVAFGLPGNPLAHFVCLHLYVRTAVRSMLGLSQLLGVHSARLSADLEEASNPRDTLWPAFVEYASDGARLSLLRWSSSGDISCLASANALARVPANCCDLRQGSPIDFFPFGL